MRYLFSPPGIFASTYIMFRRKRCLTPQVVGALSAILHCDQVGKASAFLSLESFSFHSGTLSGATLFSHDHPPGPPGLGGGSYLVF